MSVLPIAKKSDETGHEQFRDAALRSRRVFISVIPPLPLNQARKHECREFLSDFELKSQAD
jgi:hypothetical protein